MKAEILGKPAASFFLTALADINVSPEDVSSSLKGFFKNPITCDVFISFYLSISKHFTTALGT